MKNTALTLLLVVSFSELLFSQDAFIKQYTIKDGLPTNTIRGGYQSSDGFIWFCSVEGAFRYDGKNFKCFSKEDGLSDNNVIKIKEDLYGRIWFLNNNGTINFFYKNKFYSERNEPFLGELKNSSNIQDFFQDIDSTLYFYSQSTEIFVVKNNEFVDYATYKLTTSSKFSALFYLDKTYDGRFGLWSSEGIYSIKSLGDSLNQDCLKRGNINRVFPSNKDDKIVVEVGGYINFYHRDSIASYHIIKAETQVVNSIVVDDEGFFWVATQDKGLYCYNGDKIIQWFDINGSELLKDKENNIWITTSTKGIFKINRMILKSPFFLKNQLTRKAVKGLAKSDQMGIWLSTGERIYLLKNNDLYEVSEKFDNRELSSIYPLNNKNLLVFSEYTYPFLLIGMNVDEKSKTIKFDKSGMLPFKVKDVTVGREKQYFYSFMYNSLIKYPINQKEKAMYIPFKLGRIRNIFTNRYGEIVINSTVNYLFKDINNVVNCRVLNPLNGKTITAHLNIDTENELYCVEGEDLYLLNKSKLFDLTENYKNQIKYQVRNLIYSDSILYFSTAKNVFFIRNPFKIISGKIIQLEKLDVEFNNINALLVNDKILYIAADDGLTLYPYSELSFKQKVPPKPFIENVYINDEIFDFANRTIKGTGIKKIVIEFDAINFSSLATVYSYKLEGFDQNWNEGNETRVVYSNLRPGNYIFRLSAFKVGGEKSQSLELPIIVYPTLIQRPVTWIVLGSLVLAFILLIVVYIKNRQIKKKEAESLMLTFELKTLQSMMNPHFIFNALGSIQSYLLQNKSEEAGYYLSQFAKLIRKNVNSLKSNFITLEDEIERLKNYLELESFRMGQKFKFDIWLDPNFDADEICIPSMIIQPFVENAIWHGISPLPGEGFIYIRFEKNDERSIYAVIEDNGVGINKTKTTSKSEQHLNLGVELTRKRIILIGEHYNVNATIITEDIQPGSLNPGTRVKIIIPILTELSKKIDFASSLKTV